MKGKENAEQKAYRLIIHDIKTKCQPGDFLLERDLAERFGVSRTPVTIALNRLVAEGLLQKLPKKGCFIPNLNYDDARRLLSVSAFCLNVRRRDVRHRMHKLKTYWKWNVSWRLRRKLSTQTTSSASRSGTRTSIMRWCRPPTICICMTHGHAFICAAIYTPAFSIGFTHVKHRSNPARWRNIRLFSMHYATMIRNWPFRW